MFKYILIVSLAVTLVFSDDANKSTHSESIVQSQLNSTQHQKSAISIKNSTISENKNINKNVIEEAKSVGKGTAELVNKEKAEPVVSESEMDDVDDGVDFKYYWVLLVFSSLSIISIIVFKSFRLRKSRAEVKYGKPKEADEIQPLGKKSKWDDDSSENEDEIFDINFLKNTRLNPHNREDV